MTSSSFQHITPCFTEASLPSAWQSLQQFWQRGQHHSFLTFDQRRICHSSFRHPSARAELVISPGRIEASQKYQEFCFDLYQAGFTVHLIDHRGQGLSDRLNPDRHLGDVADFQHYVQDFALWMEHQILPAQQAPLLGLAHSMGSAILCRYLQQQNQHGFRAAIYCSPMFGIQSHPVPQPIATPLIRFIAALNVLCSKKNWYFPGQGPYQDNGFVGNHLTHSLVRYQQFRQLYSQQPELQLGGVSARWLQQAILAIAALHQAPALTLPQLILQATEDPVVDPELQRQFQQKHPALTCDLVQIKGALHEIIFETDPVRQQLFDALNDFLAKLGL